MPETTVLRPSRNGSLVLIRYPSADWRRISRRKFSRDESREDKRGNLYTPKHTIKFKTRGRRGFVARPYLSYTDDKRNRRFVSRFVFKAIY